ncbi:MAG TPA: molybdopterin cofactor-binding domain-containing protein [Kofleriaceae bacterium]|nr:molybdopterin cofactor-binding domain-containing protein [Kofleriaceae bacterium]
MNPKRGPAAPDGAGWTRRSLLQVSALAGGGLALGATLPLGPRLAHARGGPAAEAALNAWVRISASDQVTIVVSQAEMGQGISTTLPAVLAEELGADWSRVKLETPVADPAYRNPRTKTQFTGNSESISSFFEIMRAMGASAREMLIAAAAAQWKVQPATCRVENGRVFHDPSKRSLRFGDVAAAAAKLPAPDKPPLKDPSQWRLLGKPLPRVDVPSKVDGTAVFGLDFTVPGMVYAAVKLCPVFGGKLRTHDAAAVTGRPGVLAVVPLPDGVAVVAKSYWQARQAADALPASFDEGPGAAASHDGIMQIYRAAMADGASWVLTKPGTPAGAALPATLTAEYESQFLAHAAMEPINCTARVDASGCDVWAPTQGQELAQLTVTSLLGLPNDKVRIHRTQIGGGFGRRLIPDFIAQAVTIAREVRRPVKVVWSREDDMQHDFYRPAVVHRISAALDRTGQLTHVAHKLVSPSILQFAAPRKVTATFDPSCLEGLYETHYEIPSWKVESKLIQVPVPTSVLRTTGYGPNIFALESFVDELAHHQRRDPLAYRLALLRSNARATTVLSTAAERAGWAQKPPAGRHRGIAYANAYGSFLAHVVELSVSAAGAITIHRVVAAIDPGIVLDPGITVSAIEGGTAWGLSCALTSEITFARGRTVQSNFHDFSVLRMHQMPPVEVHLINSGVLPLGGTGEIGPVTIIPALTNAIFAATGKRLRSLPLSRHGLSLA